MTLLASLLPPEIPKTDPVQQGLLAVVNGTYDAIASEGLDRDSIHRLPVCYQASSLIVNGLLDNGHAARHESITKEGVGAHSYVILDGTNNEEIIIDATWQQFLPKDRVAKEDMPRVIIGTRTEVIAKARNYGVDENYIKVWETNSGQMDVDEQQTHDREAEAAFDEAEASGAWEKFTAQTPK